MSKVKINYHESGVDRQAVRVGDAWRVEIDGKWYPYDDHEVTRVPAHLGEYDPHRWSEQSAENAAEYDRYNRLDPTHFGRYRKAGPAT